MTLTEDGAHQNQPGVSVPAPRLQRSTGLASIEFRSHEGMSRPYRLYQEGAAKLRLPRASGTPEAVIINTAGGLTGGDRFAVDVTLGPDAALTALGQACEKIYRSCGGTARIVCSVQVAAGARLEWLPQPTILFDGARLDRRLRIDMAEDATVLAVEACILGRTAMAEEVRTGAISDGWSVRRGERLVLADRFAIEGEISAQLASAATLGGARAFASVVYGAVDAGDRLDAVREISCTCEGAVAVSAWNGLMVIRFLAHDGRCLTGDLVTVLSAIRGRPMPRVWAV